MGIYADAGGGAAGFVPTAPVGNDAPFTNALDLMVPNDYIRISRYD
jgi:hypothetical protein